MMPVTQSGTITVCMNTAGQLVVERTERWNLFRLLGRLGLKAVPQFSGWTYVMPNPVTTTYTYTTTGAIEPIAIAEPEPKTKKRKAPINEDIKDSWKRTSNAHSRKTGR